MNPSPSPENRNSRGEWRPDYPVTYAPLFQWPPQLKSMMKWLFGWPGYLWPWNVIYAVIVLITWKYLTPSLETCAILHWKWMGFVFLRNLALLWIMAGTWHLLLYILKLQGTHKKYDAKWQSTQNPSFLFKDQVLDNIFWSSVSGVSFWTAYEILFLWAWGNHLIPFIDWRAHPIYSVLLLALIPFWREFHFYWIHRLIHWKPLYRTVHYLHHKNVNPGPWSGLAMHPVEHLLYFSVVLIHWIIPSHPFHFIFNLQHTALTPIPTHHGFEGPVLKDKVPSGSYFHYLHHRYFECNYGESTLPFDKWFGTFRDGLPNGTGSKLQESGGR